VARGLGRRLRPARPARGRDWFKLVTARWFYRVFERLHRLDLEQSGDFRLIDRQSLDSLLTLRERTASCVA